MEKEKKTKLVWDKKGQFKASRHPINGYRLYTIKQIKKLANKLKMIQ